MLSKDSQEIIPLQFDYTSALGVETITGQLMVVTVLSGRDASPASILQSAATQAAGVVTQWLTGGLVGVTYHVRCKVVTSGARTLVASTELQVINR